MSRRRYHWTVDLTYWVEVRVGRIWDRLADDQGSAGWFDRVPAWASDLRYRQERKHPETFQ